jgi:hypothetical protein
MERFQQNYVAIFGQIDCYQFESVLTCDSVPLIKVLGVCGFIRCFLDFSLSMSKDREGK